MDTRGRMQRGLDAAMAQVDRRAARSRTWPTRKDSTPTTSALKIGEIRAPYVDAVAALVSDSDANARAGEGAEAALELEGVDVDSKADGAPRDCELVDAKELVAMGGWHVGGPSAQ